MLIGCVVAPFVPVDHWAWLAVAGVAGVLAVVTRGGRVATLAVALALGAARTAWAAPGPARSGDIAYAIGLRGVTVTGTVWAEPDARGDRTRLRIWVDTLTTADGGVQALSGWVLVTAPPLSPERLAATGAGAWAYGDSVSLSGDLQSPPRFADFDYRAFLERQGVHVIAQPAELTWLGAGGGWGWVRAGMDLKQAARRRLAELFPEPHAALLQGILLGDDNNIPPSLTQSFRATGTTHILAISGKVPEISPSIVNVPLAVSTQIFSQSRVMILRFSSNGRSSLPSSVLLNVFSAVRTVFFCSSMFWASVILA